MKQERPNIVLLANDSYFAYLLAKPFMSANIDKISHVILSNFSKGSCKQLRKIYLRASKSYFAYRTLVQVFSFIQGNIWGKSIRKLAKRFNIPCYVSSKINDHVNIICGRSPDLGIALNFDQILKKSTIEFFKRGIINVHASKLPKDRGISPVLWAFARGDDEIWSTIYCIDIGIDTGPILDQFSIPVKPHDTAFSLYESVCFLSGYRLKVIIKKFLEGKIVATPQSTPHRVEYFSWPDDLNAKWMRKNNRKFISWRDVIHKLRKSDTTFL